MDDLNGAVQPEAQFPHPITEPEVSDVEPEGGDGNDDAESDTATDAEAEVEENNAPATATRSGRRVQTPRRLTTETGMAAAAAEASNCTTASTEAEETCHATMHHTNADNDKPEIACVGAGLGGGFTHTSELRPMKFKEAVAGPESDEWRDAVEEEFDRVIKHNVWEPVKKKEVPANAHVIDST